MEYGKYTGYEFQDVDVWVEVTDKQGDKTLVTGCLYTVISELLELQRKNGEFKFEITDCFL